MRIRRQLWTWPISAKRYALLRESGDGFNVFDNKDHGLGHLLNPTPLDIADRDWRREIWRWAVAMDLGEPVKEPDWFNLPAVSQVTASSPLLLKPFARLNEGLSYVERIKPFNFLISVHVHPFGHPTGVDPQRFHLIAAYETDPAKWLSLAWVDRYSGKEVRITTGADTPPSMARVKTYRDVAEFFRTHPEPKSAARDGSPVAANTRGLLRRREVQTVGFEYHGKESNRLEEVQAGLVHDPKEVSVSYGSTEWARAAHRLGEFTVSELADAAGVSDRYISAIRNGHADPSDRVKRALLVFLRAAGAVRIDGDEGL